MLPLVLRHAIASGQGHAERNESFSSQCRLKVKRVHHGLRQSAFSIILVPLEIE